MFFVGLLFGANSQPALGLYFIHHPVFEIRFGALLMLGGFESMTCHKCRSNKLKKFTSEVAIHFPGLSGLKKPIVWAFPELYVCRDCGFTEFSIPKKELAVLVSGKAVKGAVALV